MWKGLWNHQLTQFYLLSLPAALPAVWLGRLANHRFPPDTFRKYVFGGLIGVGLALAVQAFPLRPGH
jgi:uncharacterized membrane protein YfcA